VCKIYKKYNINKIKNKYEYKNKYIINIKTVYKKSEKRKTCVEDQSMTKLRKVKTCEKSHGIEKTCQTPSIEIKPLEPMP